MGFLPKHIKRGKERRSQRLIALAALAGAVIVRERQTLVGPAWHPGLGRKSYYYTVYYPDGQISHAHNSRGTAAYNFLRWYWEQSR